MSLTYPNTTNPFAVPLAAGDQLVTDDVASPYPDAFGAIKTGTDLRRAALATLQLWMPTYIAEIARQAGLVPPGIPGLAAIASWQVVANFDELPDSNLPCLMVTSPGVAGKPVRHGSGLTDVIWGLDVYVVISGQDWGDTADKVGYYAAAARAALAQHGSLGGLAEWTRWEGESYGRIPQRQSRTLGGALVMFHSCVRSVLNTHAGPATIFGGGTGPDTPPFDVLATPTPLPVVTKIGINIANERPGVQNVEGASTSAATAPATLDESEALAGEATSTSQAETPNI